MHETESIRLDQFRTLQQTIRGSDEHLVVGIDIAKEHHHAFFGTANGKALFRRLIFDNTIQGFTKLMTQAEAIKVQHCFRQVVFGLEPTANYHKPLGEYLIRCGQMVVLVSNSAVKKNRELLDGRWDKHDTKDAANVADLITQGKCLYYEYPEVALRNLRALLALKRRFKKHEFGYRVRIKNHLLAQYFPELDRLFGPAESIAVVRKCLNPAEIAGMDYDQFSSMIAGSKRSLPQDRRLRAIWQVAPDSIGCQPAPAVNFEAQVMVDGLKQLRATIKQLDAKIEEICLTFPEYQYLLSIPGFGPDVSSKVLGAIGDPHRFAAGGQVLKMAGYDLCANRSGKTSERATPVISKRGKADLRYALYQAALIASLKNKDFIIYFTNKLRGRDREKGVATKMRVKLAAKLLIIAWTLMKKGEPFNPAYLNQQ
jgi:transposase